MNLISVHILLVSIVWIGSNGQQNPIISYISSNQEVNIGDTLDIKCSVQYAADFSVIWAKVNLETYDTVFISKGASLTVPDSRYSIRLDEASHTYTLQISQITEVDAGTYQCQVITGSKLGAHGNVNVSVFVEPEILDNSTEILYVNEGENITLECFAKGVPTPVITWRRENNDILPMGADFYKGKLLKIHSVNREHRGTYFCIAENKIAIAKRNIVLKVHFPPFLRIHPIKPSQAVNYPIDLKCHVEAFPEASIVWLKDGHQLDNNKHQEFPTSRDSLESILQIESVHLNDYGTYACVASNKFGQTSRYMELTRSETPNCPYGCESNHSTQLFVSKLINTVTTIIAILLLNAIFKKL
jgi:lachesin